MPSSVSAFECKCLRVQVPSSASAFEYECLLVQVPSTESVCLRACECVCSGVHACSIECKESPILTGNTIVEKSDFNTVQSLKKNKLDKTLKIHRQRINNSSLKVCAKFTSCFPCYKELHALVEKI